MKNPKNLYKTVKISHNSKGTTANLTEVTLPTYIVENGEIVDGKGLTVQFCKGNINDDTFLRQEGVFTESLIQAAKEFLIDVNAGEMKTDETTQAILKLDEALMWINKRAEDRKLREVQGTYQK